MLSVKSGARAGRFVPDMFRQDFVFISFSAQSPLWRKPSKSPFCDKCHKAGNRVGWAWGGRETKLSKKKPSLKIPF